MEKPGLPLVHEAIDAAGGLDRWRRVSALTLHIRSGGIALALKRQSKALADYDARIIPARQHLTITPFGPGYGIFDAGKAALYSQHGTQLAVREQPREEFKRFRRHLWWDQLDTLYFAGYAVWVYLTLPFLLAQDGFELTELEPWDEDRETFRRIRAVFPAHIHCHSRIQHLYFDRYLRLRRHDYVAEVFGAWAKMAHYTWDYQSYGWLPVAARRAVYAHDANGRMRPFPRFIWAEVDNARIVEE